MIQRHVKYTLNNSQVLSLLSAFKSVISFSLYCYLGDAYYCQLSVLLMRKMGFRMGKVI